MGGVQIDTTQSRRERVMDQLLPTGPASANRTAVGMRHNDDEPTLLDYSGDELDRMRQELEDRLGWPDQEDV
jgi:hypothetical protein